MVQANGTIQEYVFSLVSKESTLLALLTLRGIVFHDYIPQTHYFL